MQKRKGGRKKLQETRHPVYKGVRQRKGKWVCELRQPSRKNARVDAATAYDVAALASKGNSAASLNSQTCSARAVQFAAAEAAEKHFLQTQREGWAPSGSFFWDEEEVFNMPELLNSMAEALIITPPALESGFNWVAAETTLDLTLWGN